MRKILLLSFLLSAASLASCMHAPNLDPMRRDIEQQYRGAHFDSEFKISLGPVGLWFVRALSGLVPDDEVREYRTLLRDMQRVEVAVYKIESELDDEPVRTPQRLRRMLEDRDWEIAVRVQDGNEGTWVLYREENGKVRDLYVATLGSDELVLVRVRGRLDRIIAWAMDKHGPRSRGGSVDL